MKISDVSMVSAAIFGVAGMLLGSSMAIAGNFMLSHAHAHINLAGWATLALYGLYHRGVERRSETLARWQVWIGVIGTAIFTIALAFYLLSGTETKPFLLMSLVGGVATAVSMILFLVLIVKDVRERR